MGVVASMFEEELVSFGNGDYSGVYAGSFRILSRALGATPSSRSCDL